MRKKIFTVVLVLTGSVLWWVLTNTAELSVKKWGTKLDTVIRHSMKDLGLKDSDVLSSVNEIIEDGDDRWIQHRWKIKNVSAEQKRKLKKTFEDSGAQVKSVIRDGERTFIIKRNSRIYQEIRFVD